MLDLYIWVKIIVAAISFLGGAALFALSMGQSIEFLDRLTFWGQAALGVGIIVALVYNLFTNTGFDVDGEAEDET